MTQAKKQAAIIAKLKLFCDHVVKNLEKAAEVELMTIQCQKHTLCSIVDGGPFLCRSGSKELIKKIEYKLIMKNLPCRFFFFTLICKDVLWYLTVKQTKF